MGSNGNITLFTSDGSSTAGAADYVSDVFSDVSLPATNNTSLTSTASTNPLSDSFANSDAAQYGVKTLWIKDMVLIDDRTKWVSNKPTYRVLFSENFPAIKAYAFGNVVVAKKIGQDAITCRSIADGMGVNGKVRRVTWIVAASTSATATAQLALDGANTTTIDFSGSPFGFGQVYREHGSSNETNDLHDYRLSSLQASTLDIVGVRVYFENSGVNIEQLNGTTYVNKTKVTTSAGATLSLPSFGSSLGGHALLYKTGGGAYTISALSSTSVISSGIGSSGTNLLAVGSGTGSSFLAGYGIVAAQGTSMYVGIVQSISTDTLTVSPTLPFGISASIYTHWKSGSTLGINASLMTLSRSIDFSNVPGMSRSIIDPLGRFNIWSANMGVTTVAGSPAALWVGASGYLNIDGYFSAAEVEWTGGAIQHATFGIDGFPAFGINAGTTGPIRQTLFTDAGPGWHQASIQVGASMGALAISRINLYTRRDDIGVSYGAIAAFDTLQSYTERTAVNATMMALGLHRRVYADQLPLKGSWVRGFTTSAAGGVVWYGASTNSSLTYEYYGKNFALVGTAASAATFSIDGVGIANTFNAMQTVASEGFHKVIYTVGSGSTAQIQALDIQRTKTELVSLQNVQTAQFDPKAPVAPRAPTQQIFTTGADVYTRSSFPAPLYIRVRMVGAGGGGGGGSVGSSAGLTGSTGGNSSFGGSFLVAAGGVGGGRGDSTGRGVAGAGGVATIGTGALGISTTGSYGESGGLSAASSVTAYSGGGGGNSAFGGAGAGGVQGSNSGTGVSASTNSGSGGGGGAQNDTTNNFGSGGGGGAGGFVDAVIPNPAATYLYSVGSKGTGGSGVGGTSAGGDGADGIIEVTEYYQ